MQTFMPFPQYRKVAQVLDYQRLGKQRVEAWQIHRILTGAVDGGGYKQHPAVLAWVGYTDSLSLYIECMIAEWKNRGYKNTIIVPQRLSKFGDPWWLWKDKITQGHRGLLFSKDPVYYKQFARYAGKQFYYPHQLRRPK